MYVKNDYEILIINDGSFSNSHDYYSSLRGKEKINLIELDSNYGVSYARNIGIKNSTKEFIMFVDADDELINSFDNFDMSCDFVIFPHKLMDEISNFTYGYDFENKIEKDEIKNLIEKYLNNPLGNSIFTYCWSKIFKKSFLLKNQIKFDINLDIYEDLEFVSKCFLFARTVIFHKKTFYKYNQTNNSSSNNIFRQPLGFELALKNYGQLISNERLYFKSISIFKIKTLSVLFDRSRIITMNEYQYVISQLTQKSSNPIEYKFARSQLVKVFLKFELFKFPRVFFLINYAINFIKTLKPPKFLQKK